MRVPDGPPSSNCTAKFELLPLAGFPTNFPALEGHASEENATASGVYGFVIDQLTIPIRHMHMLYLNSTLGNVDNRRVCPQGASAFASAGCNSLQTF